MATLFGRRIGLKPVTTKPNLDQIVGKWVLTIHPPWLAPTDMTVFRGIPTQLSSFDFEDPFGPATMAFTLPAVTIFDAPGRGELAWITKESNVDLLYVGALPDGYPGKGFAWEGYLTSWDWGENGFTLECAGAMRQSDLELAKPGYPSQPIPYEVAIANCFTARPWLRTAPVRVEWPTWWKTVYAAPAKGTPPYMIPVGVSVGRNWTGLLTRSTGQWDQLLTGYVNGLLTSMYTERGRWTLDLDPGRVPVLRHRDMPSDTSETDICIDAAQPGVKVNLSEDWSQSTNVLYGQGSSLSGVGYTGMQVSPDGASTSYQPLAAARQVEPATDKNGWYQRWRMRRETMLQLQGGLDESQARNVAAAHLMRFGDPGVTGTITMTSDPTIAGKPVARHLVRAGMTVRLPKVFGTPEGPLLHVTKSGYDFSTDTLSLTVDSKYRDALTVDEVRLRGRDALNISRMLATGQYQPPVPDQLLPWDYSAGSGCIPSGPQYSSQRLWAGMPADTPFPWTDWTTQRPPKSAAWRSCYIHLSPASVNADNNWSRLTDSVGAMIGIPIKMAQAGQIRLLQLAAYDGNGNVLAVPFHFSLYYSRGVNYQAMPLMPQMSADGLVNYETLYAPYKAGQHYPFFPSAWEAYNADGTITAPETGNATQTSGLVKAWGSNYEKAGYWPGSMQGGGAPTGLLVDEAAFAFDTSNFDASNFDPRSAPGPNSRNASNPLAGQVYAMIWCDGQANQDVYFAGRMFRVEPGTGT